MFLYKEDVLYFELYMGPGAELSAAEVGGIIGSLALHYVEL